MFKIRVIVLLLIMSEIAQKQEQVQEQVQEQELESPGPEYFKTSEILSGLFNELLDKQPHWEVPIGAAKQIFATQDPAKHDEIINSLNKANMTLAVMLLQIVNNEMKTIVEKLGTIDQDFKNPIIDELREKKYSDYHIVAEIIKKWDDLHPAPVEESISSKKIEK